MRASKEKRRLCRPPRQWCRFSLCPFAYFRYCVARAEKIGEPPIIPKFFGVLFQWLVEPPVAWQKKSVGFMRIFATHLSHFFDHWWHHFCLWLFKPHKWLGKPQTLHTCPIFFRTAPICETGAYTALNQSAAYWFSISPWICVKFVYKLVTALFDGKGKKYAPLHYLSVRGDFGAKSRWFGAVLQSVLLYVLRMCFGSEMGITVSLSE